AKRRMCVVERRADRAGRDAERLGDRGVVEVGVVAKEEHESLALGKRGERRWQRRSFGRSGGAKVGELVERVVAAPPAPRASRRVHDGGPEPRLEAALAAKARARAERAGERVLHGVAGGLDVAADRLRDLQKAVEVAAV